MAQLYGGSARNSGMVAPRRPTGEVLFNGAMNQGDVTAAANNISPLYPMPTGQYWNAIETVSRGDLCFRMPSSLPLDMYSIRADNATVCAISALNGQGYAGQSEVEFLNSIDILGIAMMPNDVNGGKVFNIHTGGIYTVPNNGNETIPMGSWVIAYAPSTDELLSGGGLKREAEKNGLVKLWYKPYKPSIHKMTGKNIFDALSKSKSHDGSYSHNTAHLNEFNVASKHFVSSLLGAAIIINKFMDVYAKELTEAVNAVIAKWDLNTQIDPNVNGDLRRAALLHIFGHYSFVKSNSDDPFPKLRSQLLDCLFTDSVTHYDKRQQNSKLFNQPIQGLSGDVVMIYKKLRQTQSETVGLFIQATATFFHYVADKVIGKAVTSGDPGNDFDIQLRGYAR